MVNKSKCKGNQFEYDVQASLKQLWQDVYRTSERGYQLRYDLHTDEGKAIFECKRWRTISFNALVKIYALLSPDSSERSHLKPYLIYQTNNQPCLVYYHDEKGCLIRPFKDVFGVPFIKHPPTRGPGL
jgi:hypothetical protein